MTNEGKLQNSIAKMAKQRERIFGTIQELSQAQLDFQPAAGSWSIGQIAQHVGLAERGLMNIVRNMFQDSGGQRVLKVDYDQLPLVIKGIPKDIARIGIGLLRPLSYLARFAPKALVPFLIANPIVKAKAVPQTEPTHGMARAEIVAFLIAVRQSTMELLESVKDKDLSQFHWVHPLLGYQDLGGTLDLIASHDHRHIRQMDNVRKDSSFPS